MSHELVSRVSVLSLRQTLERLAKTDRPIAGVVSASSAQEATRVRELAQSHRIPHYQSGVFAFPDNPEGIPPHDLSTLFAITAPTSLDMDNKGLNQVVYQLTKPCWTATFDKMTDMLGRHEGEIVVHCNAGHDRSPAVALGFAIKQLGIKRMDEALGFLHGIRPQAKLSRGADARLAKGYWDSPLLFCSIRTWRACSNICGNALKLEATCKKGVRAKFVVAYSGTRQINMAAKLLAALPFYKRHHNRFGMPPIDTKGRFAFLHEASRLTL